MRVMAIRKILRIGCAGIKLISVSLFCVAAAVLKGSTDRTGNSESRRIYWQTLLADEADNPDKDSINLIGSFNRRTGKFDDGTDPFGSYGDKS